MCDVGTDETRFEYVFRLVHCSLYRGTQICRVNQNLAKDLSFVRESFTDIFSRGWGRGEVGNDSSEICTGFDMLYDLSDQLKCGYYSLRACLLIAFVHS